MRISTRTFLAGTLVVLMAALAYLPGLGGGYVFDDYANLVDDADWKIDELTLRGVRRVVSEGIASDFGRPLAMLSFALNHLATGLDPFPIKLTNLAMHLFNGLLVFAFCRRIFALAPGPGPHARLGAFAAWAVTAAWLVHPLQVSTVLYAVQRMEIGAATGILLALLAYLRARESQWQGRRSWPWFMLALLATALGLGFKESAVLVPAFAWLLELTILRFRAVSPAQAKGLRVTYAAGAAAAAIVFVGWVLPTYLAPEAYAFRDFSLAQRLATQPHVLATYLGQIALPLPARLPFYYDAFPVSRGWWSPPGTLVGLLVMGGLATAAVLLRRRAPFAALGIGWLFVAHALTSNVIPLELAFEHRNYLALLGPLLALADLGVRVVRHLDPMVPKMVSVIVVCFLGGLCALQSATWGDPLRLALTLSARAPDSPRASYDLGLTMLRRAGGNWDSPLVSVAQRQLEQAAALEGASPLADQALIILASRRNQSVPRTAWDTMRTKLGARAAGPQEEAALYGIIACRTHGYCKFSQADDQQLLDTILVAVQRNPDSPVVLSQYANFAVNVMRDADLAESLARRVIRLDPDRLQYRANLLAILNDGGGDPAEIAALRSELAAADSTGEFAGWTRDPLAPAAGSGPKP